MRQAYSREVPVLSKEAVCGLRTTLIVSRFNDKITEKLLWGAYDALKTLGVFEYSKTRWVSGAFELPLAAQYELTKDTTDLIICLGCIIRGDTPHFDFVAAESARGIMDISLKGNKPVIYGVITTETIEQAIERSEKNKQNKGYEAVLAGLEMAIFLKT